MNGYKRSLIGGIAWLWCLLFSITPFALFAQEPELTSGQTVTAPEPAGVQDRSGQGMIQKGETLTLNQCIAIALRKNPNILAAAGDVSISRSRVGQARSSYYPQVNALAGYTRSASGNDRRITGTGSSLPGQVTVSTSRYDEYRAGVTLDQNILDFRTSSTVDAAKYGLESSRSDLIAVENSVVLTVKQSYYDVLQSKRNRDVAADVIRQFELHLEQAKGFYEVGTRARIDVMRAEVDLSNAKLNLINAENSLKIAWVTLNNAMGVPDAPEYGIEDNLSFQPFDITLDEATEKAFDNRPDLKALIKRRQAAESDVSVARSGHFPVLSANASYTKAGINRHPDDLSEGWSAGILLTVPLFSGFLTNHQVAEAKSTVYVLNANEEALRQQILLEVRQAYLNLHAAEASISTAELAVQQAKENLDLANGRYAAGVGSPVEVSDSFATYVSAQANYTSSLANYKLARATIENAMGLR